MAGLAQCTPEPRGERGLQLTFTSRCRQVGTRNKADWCAGVGYNLPTLHRERGRDRLAGFRDSHVLRDITSENLQARYNFSQISWVKKKKFNSILIFSVSFVLVVSHQKFKWHSSREFHMLSRGIPTALFPEAAFPWLPLPRSNALRAVGGKR